MNFACAEMGKRIAKRRKQLGLKQNMLAEKLNISNNHMSCIETGRTQPSLILLAQICNELKVTPDYLIMGAMRSSSVSQSFLELLELCTEADRELLYHTAKYMAERNGNQWNNDNFV